MLEQDIYNQMYGNTESELILISSPSESVKMTPCNWSKIIICFVKKKMLFFRQKNTEIGQSSSAFHVEFHFLQILLW